jgi:TetR/AcrR family transcriptional repressor of bet genes
MSGQNKSDGTVKMDGNTALARPDNRQVLIDAMLDSIADIGLLRSSVTEIIARAGLSRGMIHLHFQGKENLIIAAAKHNADTYYARLERHLSKARPEPQFRVEAMVLCDLGPEGLTERETRITHEFQAAVKAYPALAPHTDTRDTRLRDMFQNAFFEILTSMQCDDAKERAHDLSHATVAITEGLWVDFMLHPRNFDRDDAARVVFRTLAAQMPRHFDLSGAKTP